MSGKEAAKAFVNGLIAKKRVVVFSKTTCGYCTRAKEALSSLNLSSDDYECVELEKRADCSAIQDYLNELTGARSVPRVFIDGKFFGGGDDTVKAKKDGTLIALLNTAKR